MSFFFMLNPKHHLRGGMPRFVSVVGADKRLRKTVEDREIRTDELRDEIYKLLAKTPDGKEWDDLIKRIFEMEEEEDAMILMLIQ